jgi:hypothetical protein
MARHLTPEKRLDLVAERGDLLDTLSGPKILLLRTYLIEKGLVVPGWKSVFVLRDQFSEGFEAVRTTVFRHNGTLEWLAPDLRAAANQHAFMKIWYKYVEDVKKSSTTKSGKSTDLGVSDEFYQSLLALHHQMMAISDWVVCSAVCAGAEGYVTDGAFKSGNKFWSHIEDLLAGVEDAEVPLMEQMIKVWNEDITGLKVSARDILTHPEGQLLR